MIGGQHAQLGESAEAKILGDLIGPSAFVMPAPKQLRHMVTRHAGEDVIDLGGWLGAVCVHDQHRPLTVAVAGDRKPPVHRAGCWQRFEHLPPGDANLMIIDDLIEVMIITLAVDGAGCGGCGVAATDAADQIAGFERMAIEAAQDVSVGRVVDWGGRRRGPPSGFMQRYLRDVPVTLHPIEFAAADHLVNGPLGVALGAPPDKDGGAVSCVVATHRSRTGARSEVRAW